MVTMMCWISKITLVPILQSLAIFVASIDSIAGSFQQARETPLLILPKESISNPKEHVKGYYKVVIIPMIINLILMYELFCSLLRITINTYISHFLTRYFSLKVATVKLMSGFPRRTNKLFLFLETG